MRGGARIGWITGLFCFALFLIFLLAALFALTHAGSIPELRDNPSMKNPAIQDFIKRLNDPAQATEIIVMTIVAFFLFLTTLPMLGGALGASLADKRSRT